MRSFATVALAILSPAVPSASFTLPSAHRVQDISISRNHAHEFSMLHATAAMEEAISKEDNTTSASYYDPSDIFTEEPPFSDLTFGVMKEDLYQEEDNVSMEINSEQTVEAICRDLDDLPLSKDYFARTMGIANVESYTTPAKDAFRGFMSNACRVHLLPGGETAFYKRIVFDNLDHAWEKFRTAPHKLIRDSKSYQVVASFLLSKACRDMIEKTGVHIPKCYDAKLEPNHSNPIESKFSFLLEDFAPSDGWYQVWLLDDIEECKVTLSTLAKIHAYFWDGSDFWNDADAAKELEEGVWKSGSYVQPKAQNMGQCKNVAKEWAKKRLRFKNELSPFDYWDNLGERLESVAEECGHVAHPFADKSLSKQYKKYRTFTHGDPKSANMFFRSTEAELQVGLIDYQWSGFGLAATDIAHFITSGIHSDMLEDGGEEVLLRYYFDELQKNLVEFGAFGTADDAAKNFSYSTFIDQYEIGVLDLCRLVIAYTWARFEEPVEKHDKLGCAKTMNKTSYNKSIPNAVWLMSRCDEIMKSRGV